MDYTEKTLSCEEKYRGKIIYVHRDTVRLPDGAEAVREVVEHSGGVGVIPVDENGDVWCVRQFRYPFAAHLLEIPAGKLEPGEAPLECAVRELSEETIGISAPVTDQAGRVWAAVSIGAPRMRVDTPEKRERYIFLVKETARGLSEALQGRSGEIN